MDTLGADILRLWVAATDYSGELSISNEILKRVVEVYRRIRNTLRFLLANLADFDPARDALPVDEWLEIDRYALVMTHDLQRALTPSELGAKAPQSPGHYGDYEFHLVAQKLQTFCSEDLGGFYLDILKDRLYTAPARFARAALGAERAVPHHAEPDAAARADPVVHRPGSVGGAERRTPSSVFEQTWYELRAAGATRMRCATRWQRLRALRADVQKQLEALRVAGKIGSSLQAKSSSTRTARKREFLRSFGDDLRFVFITSQARRRRTSARADAVDTVMPA